jgi:hypothetical protein
MEKQSNVVMEKKKMIFVRKKTIQSFSGTSYLSLMGGRLSSQPAAVRRFSLSEHQ